MQDSKRTAEKKKLKEYWAEIVTSLVFVTMLLILIFNIGFRKNIITNFILFRPENAIIAVLMLLGLTVLFGSMFLVQRHPKTLKSTKRKSVFDATLIVSDVRTDSITQTELALSKFVISHRNKMPVDIDRNNPRVINLIFDYDERLNI